MTDISHSVFGAQSSLEPFHQEQINFSSSGDNTVIAGAANLVIRVYRLSLVVASATSLEFKDGTGTVLAGPYPLAANESIVLDFTFAGMPPWYTTSVGNGFVINSSNAVQIGGEVDYLQS